MPVDFEMILSASPPIFSTSAFMDYHYDRFHHGQHGQLNKLTVHEFGYGHSGDIRSCLVDKSDEDQQRGQKKRVWFADDKGLALTHVRVMSEPSSCPPRWSDSFLAQITKGVRTTPTSDVRWEPLFAQPASDYMAFRNKVQKMCISLENVIIRDGGEAFSGTIKVKNLAFDKEVFVRITFDRWHSSRDVPAAYVSSGVDGPSQFDTFSFNVPIPSSAVKFEIVEFCVCFRCSGREYWDNNDGQNYKLAVLGKKNKQMDHHPDIRQFNDALKVNLDSWSEFSSWSHLITDGPYW